MLKRKNRLIVGRARGGAIIATPFFTLKVFQNDLSLARFGIVISKRTEKKATARNRVKRQFRACFEKLIGKVKCQDYLFIIKKESLDKKSNEICTQIEEALKKKSFLK